VLSHFWFTGQYVMAYNDKISISAPCKTNFVGAVPGNTLVDLLKASKAKDVELILDNDNLLIKAASSRFKLGVMPSDSFLFEMPEFKSNRKLPVKGKEFLSCLSNCMWSVDENTTTPERLGVTLVAEGKELSFYSTDDKTMGYAYTELEGKTDLTRIILPAPFCVQLLKLADPEAPIQLEIEDDHVLYMAKNGVMLFGRLIETDRPLDFVEMVDHHYPAGTEEQLVSIPTKLKLILDRAVIITESNIEQPKTVVTVKEGKMRFVSKTEGRGEVYDVMQTPEHPEVSVTIDPKLLKRVYGQFTYMLVTEQAVVMAKDSKLYFVSPIA
jgi:DNA polymerase III sliding clamp (beta) subunit (PCNA family)